MWALEINKIAESQLTHKKRSHWSHFMKMKQFDAALCLALFQGLGKTPTCLSSWGTQALGENAGEVCSRCGHPNSEAWQETVLPPGPRQVTANFLAEEGVFPGLKGWSTNVPSERSGFHRDRGAVYAQTFF